MADDNKEAPPPPMDMRPCSMCQRKVSTGEGAYVGGGRWCCFACAAALYLDEDEDEDSGLKE